jgi:hypothetical protein
MPSLNTGNAILSNPIKVETTAYNVGIGGAASGSFKLQVTGTSNLTGALTGTSATFSGNVGIGSNSPASKLSVGGDGYAGRAITAIANNADFAMTLRQDSATGSGLQIFVNQNLWGSGTTPFLIANLTGNLFSISSIGAATFSSSITTPSYVQSGVNIAINSSTATTLALVDCAMLLIRDASNGGSCMCFFEIGTISIISQSGATTFTTSAPSANQIQLGVGAGSRSVTALGGSNRNGTQVRIGVFRNDGQ